LAFGIGVAVVEILGTFVDIVADDAAPGITRVAAAEERASSVGANSICVTIINIRIALMDVRAGHPIA
jgi:hypothetical protein